jgi:hypothetical protein
MFKVKVISNYGHTATSEVNMLVEIEPNGFNKGSAARSRLSRMCDQTFRRLENPDTCWGGDEGRDPLIRKII